MFTIATQNFQGPLDKLLELVKMEELDINEISLAKVTGEFLEYLDKLKETEGISHSILADFLVVASKLLLIKSKVLIPSLELEEEEEEEIHDLETQLKVYSKIKEAELNIKENWHKAPVMGEREFLAGHEVIFHPGKVTVANLKNSIMKVIGEIEKLRPVEKVRRDMINLKSKIKDIMKRISRQPVSFQEFSQSGKRSEVVILFLAILHLFHDEKIYFEQKKQFGEIKIRRV